MSLFSAFMIYILVWWVTLFAILPLGVRGQAEMDDIVEGSEPGAPVKANMKRKILLTTLVSLVIWAILCGVILSGLINLNPYSVDDV